MKKFHWIVSFPVLAAILVALPSWFLTRPYRGDAIQMRYVAILFSGAEPHEVDSDANGKVILNIQCQAEKGSSQECSNRGSFKMHLQMRVNQLTSRTTQVHLYGPGGAEENAAVILPICGGAMPTVAGGECPFDERNNGKGVTNLRAVVTAEQLESFGLTPKQFAGWLDESRLAANVHTEKYPEGEARGQLYPSER